MGKNTLGAVLKQVQGLRIRQIITNGKQTGIGIYHGKNLLESYPNGKIDKAVKDAEAICGNQYTRKHLIEKLTGEKYERGKRS